RPETSKLWSHSSGARALASSPFEVAGFSRVGAPLAYRVANWLGCKFMKAMRQRTANALRAKFTGSSIRSRESLGTATSHRVAFQATRTNLVSTQPSAHKQEVV